MKLEEWRGEIDEIDSEITALLERRAKISRKIGVLKAHASIPVTDAAREEAVIRRLRSQAGGTLSQESLARIYQRILQESRLIQAEAIAAVNRTGVEVYR